VQGGILARFKEPRAVIDGDLKLGLLRDRIAAMPAFARAFFDFSCLGSPGASAFEVGDNAETTMMNLQ
jgi:hypothetical protein